MNKKSFPICFLMLCMTLFNMTSCDLNDKVNLNTDDEDESITGDTSDEGLTREDSIAIALHLFSNLLCDNDSVTVTTLESPSRQRKADFGQLLYESTPSARYRIAQDFEDAKAKFMADFERVMLFTGISTQSDTVTIDFGSRGKLTFRPERGQGKVAVIDIDMPLIPDLTQIIFLSPQAWPHNDSDGGVRLGDTFRSSDGRRWICVQTCAGGVEYGLLVTFDNSRNDIEAHFDPACTRTEEWKGWHYTHYISDSDWQCYVHNSQYAKSEELLILNRFLYDSDGQRNELADRILSNERFISKSLHDCIFANGAYYICGDNNWCYMPKKTYPYKRYYYSENKHKWKDETDSYQYYFMGNRWFIMRPNYMNSLFYDDFWNSYNCTVGRYHILNYQFVDITNDDPKGSGITYYHSRNHDQKYDQKYVAVKAYRFHGDFGKINIEGDKLEYKDGFKPFILN